MNVKRVQRLWREEGLKVPRQQCKKRRLGTSANGSQRRVATRPNEVWSYDFVSDQTSDGRRLRFLCVVDEFTRECLAWAVRRSFRAKDVIAVLAMLIALRGAPVHLRSDNGPEFVAQAVQAWLKAHAVGRVVRAVRRRGKYLLIDLDQGLLLLHLGMSGRLSFAEHLAPAGAHDHFEMKTTQGTLRLTDPRRFGAVVFADSDSAPIAQKLLGKLGMEPLSDDFDLSRFHAGLKRRKSSIKEVLLAGDVVVGVGNIYACEVLFLAGIRPTRSAAGLGRGRIAKLHAAIRDVLARAVASGGLSLIHI